MNILGELDESCRLFSLSCSRRRILSRSSSFGCWLLPLWSSRATLADNLAINDPNVLRGIIQSKADAIAQLRSSLTGLTESTLRSASAIDWTDIARRIWTITPDAGATGDMNHEVTAASGVNVTR